MPLSDRTADCDKEEIPLQMSYLPFLSRFNLNSTRLQCRCLTAQPTVQVKRWIAVCTQRTDDRTAVYTPMSS